MNGLYTIILLILSNVFMTLAWYGHLKFTNAENGRTFPLIVFILISWGIAFIEYCINVNFSPVIFFSLGINLSFVLFIFLNQLFEGGHGINYGVIGYAVRNPYVFGCAEAFA